ncbi:MAG TPA: hypothetical protein VEG68_16135 [Terriglobales bacterium]|nr:hypothetical protein [Terriglobales bacterium]
MNKLKGLCLGALAVAALGPAARAQSSAMTSPPKVLVITREFVKPGKGGAMHDKTESAFVQAFTRAKWPTHYLGMNSLSGKSRSLFFTGYDSFEAWEKDTQAIQKNAALSAALEHAFVADGDLLDSIDGGVFVYNQEYSLNPHPATAATRYFEVSVFRVKEGHHKEWDDGVKLVIAAYQKALPDAHWGCFEVSYGAPEGTYIFLTALKSASEIDSVLARNKDFMAAMGEDGMKKLEEISAAAIESGESNLFMLNPKMSYVGDEWITADPDFWKPKPAAAPAAAPKKPAEKTGTGQ